MTTSSLDFGFRSAAAPPAAAERKQRPAPSLPPINSGDRAFFGLLTVAGLIAPALLVLFLVVLIYGAMPSFRTFGWGFITSLEWDPTEGAEHYGALAFLAGSVTSAIGALLIAGPIGILVATFIHEVAPVRVRSTLRFLIETLATVPSVVYGLWGFYILAPRLALPWQENWTVAQMLGHLPIFAPPTSPKNMLCAILILSIMILPIIVAVSLDAIRQVPDLYREAALGLGATRWEMIRLAVWPQSRTGFVGGCILALGRALGETMAVTMVIGNGLAYHQSLLRSSDTVASTIANQFDGSTELREAALIEMALLLFVITMAASLAARYVIQRMNAQPAAVDPSSFKKRIGHVWRTVIGFPARLYRKAADSIFSSLSAREGIAPTTANISFRRIKNRATIGVMVALLLFCVYPLASVLATLIIKGSQSVSFEFLFSKHKPISDGGGGIFHALVGSLCLLGVATLFAVPLGLLKGMFLARRGETRLAAVARLLLDAMTGVPAIIVGVFCYTIIVRKTGYSLQLGPSMLAGGIALAMIMLPIFARLCEQAMSAIPRIYDEAGLALGLPRRKVITRIVLRAATPAVLTGLFLALSRVGGEAAPLLFTALGSNDLPTDPLEPVNSLPQYMFANYSQPVDLLVRNSWGAALVLVVLILAMRLTTNYISLKKFGRGGLSV